MRKTYEFKTPDKSHSVRVQDFARLDESLGGVYVFRGKSGECLYVGQSISFRERLMAHLSSSHFSRLIYSADLYGIDDGFMREVFETIFIDELRPLYNRAKVFVRKRTRIDDIHWRIEALEGDVLSLEEEKAELLDATTWPVDNDDYPLEDDPLEYFSNEDEGRLWLWGDELRCAERLTKIDGEINHLKSEIRRLYRKF